MKVRVENLVRMGAIAATAFALLLPASSGVFSAGAATIGGTGNCTQALVDGARCDGTGSSVCSAGVMKCGSGTALSSCSDGAGEVYRCDFQPNCASPTGGNPKNPRSNSTGC